ncbi:hypothetical protein DIPPA_19914 [Diplonema papillatum]|nr:hypothetical protein DIPPA_19914 [Diplonema papillatum]
MEREALVLLTLASLTLPASSSHTPPDISLVYAETGGHLEPDYDTFQYTTAIYPTAELYTAGQYVRVRLSVSGHLRDGADLASQEGQWQWLNTSADEAGLMLIFHYVGNQAGDAVLNYCNATAESDVIAYSTDLSSAGGSLATASHSSVSDANTECSTASSGICTLDPDGQALDGFATFELPSGVSGLFRVCYRKSRSRFANSTEEPGFWGIADSREVDSLTPGGDWSALAPSLRHAWQEPDGGSGVFQMNGTSEFFWSTAGGAAEFHEGEYVPLRVHAGYRAELHQTASSTWADSDQLKLVPHGVPCAAEVEGSGVYPGTALCDAAGSWVESFGVQGAAAFAANGTLADRCGYAHTTADAVSVEVSPFVEGVGAGYAAASSDSEFAGRPWHVLAFVRMPEPGSYDVCYSSRADRKAGSPFYTAGGTTYLSPKIQAPGGWRKIPRGSESNVGTSLSVVADTRDTTWTNAETGSDGNAVTSDSWGALQITGTNVITTAATLSDTGATAAAKSYEVLVGGDQARLVPYSAADNPTTSVSPVGCWARGLSETDDLLGPPDLSGAQASRVTPRNAGTSEDSYLYLHVPAAGEWYSVCYRPVGGYWRVIGAPLVPEARLQNVTWYLNDTREGTWGGVVLESPSLELTTEPYAWEKEETVAVIVATVSGGCLPGNDVLGASTFTPLAVVTDVGLEESAYGQELVDGRLHSDAVRRRRVAAWIYVPQHAVDHYICLKRGGLNWQAIPNAITGSMLLTPEQRPRIDYELLDLRAGTLAAIKFQSRALDLDTGASSDLFDLSGYDEIKLLYNTSDDLRCDRSSQAPTDGIVYTSGSAAWCTVQSASVFSPCYTGWVEESIGYNDAVRPWDVQEVLHLATLPPSPVGLLLCYQQHNKNWVVVDEQLFVEPSHGIVLHAVETSLTGGAYYSFTLSTTGSILFDLAPGHDRVKLVRASEECHRPALQRAYSTDLSSAVSASLDDSSEQVSALAAFVVPIVDVVTQVKLCMRNHRSVGSNNWIRLQTDLQVEPSGVKYSLETGVLAGGVSHFRFISKVLFNTHPGADSFKLIDSSQVCTSSGSVHVSLDNENAGIINDTAGITDLGPGDGEGLVVAEASTVIPKTVSKLRVCYKLAAATRWVELREEDDSSAIAAVGLSTGVPQADTDGVLTAASVSVTGVDIGVSLISQEGLVGAGFYALIGGLETSTTDAKLTFKILGNGFDATVDLFKLVRSQLWINDRFIATGEQCQSDAEPGTETNVFGSAGGWVAPVFTLPLVSGKYLACYRIGSLPAPTWVTVAVSLLSATSPFSAVPVTDNEIPVFSPRLYYAAHGGTRLVFEDHFQRDHASAPSLAAAASSGSEEADWIRIVPASSLCSNASVATIGASAAAWKLVAQRVDGAGAASHLGTIVSPELQTWPPSLSSADGPYKVCYRKTSSSGANGNAVRVACCAWLVVPSLGNQLLGNRLLELSEPARLSWTMAEDELTAIENVTVGSPFQVSVQVVGENGEKVAGRRFVSFFDYGPDGACGVERRMCRGVGLQVLSWHCASEAAAEEYGWPGNNTRVRTDEWGKAVLRLVWNEPCSGCSVRAQLTDQNHVATPDLLFNAVALNATELSSPVLDASGMVEGASMASPLPLQKGASVSIPILALTSAGVRALSSEGTPVTLEAVSGHEALAGLSLTANGAAHSHRASFSFDLRLGPQGKLSIVLHIAPSDTFAEDTTLQLRASSPGLSSIDLNLRLKVIRTVYLQVLSVTPLESATTSFGAEAVPTWRGTGWPVLVANGEVHAGDAAAADAVNVSVAAAGYYLKASAAYTVQFQALDDALRIVPRSLIRGQVTAVAHSQSSPAVPRTDAVALPASIHDGTITVVISMGRVCHVADPCVWSFKLHASDDTPPALGTLTTPVRAFARELRMKTSIRTSATPDEYLGPIVLEAVDAFGDVDEYHAAAVWPLITGGDGLLDADNAAVRDELYRTGRAAAKLMVKGEVAFDTLRISKPCTGCSIDFVADSGLALCATPPLTITSNAHRLRGAVVDSGGYAVGSWITFELYVVDQYDARTTWVSEWIAGARDAGAAPFVFSGGGTQKMEDSRLAVRVQFLQPCAACRLQFSAPEGAWSAAASNAVWLSPAMAITDSITPTQIVLSAPPYDLQNTILPEVDGRLSPDVNPGGLGWYSFRRSRAVFFPVALVDDHGNSVQPTSAFASRSLLVSVQKQVGDDFVDGTGGSYVTDPLTVRLSGLPLDGGEAVLSVTFPRPCLQCKLTLTDTAIGSTVRALELLITVLPNATRISPYPTSTAVPAELVPHGGQAADNASVWFNATFALLDEDAVVYDVDAPVSLSTLRQNPDDLTVASPVQDLLCLSCSGAHAGFVVSSRIRSNTILEQVSRRLSSVSGPFFLFTVSGQQPSVTAALYAGTSVDPSFNATVSFPEQYTWTSSFITWQASPPPTTLRILQQASFLPPWPGVGLRNTSGSGYLLTGDHPSLDYAVTPPVYGVPFPFTVQVLDINGDIAAGCGGVVTASIVQGGGCGSGEPLYQEGGTVVHGNTTIWLTFGSNCQKCYLELKYAALAGTESQALPMAETTKYTPAFTVVRPAAEDVVVDPNLSHVPAEVLTTDVSWVVLKVVAFAASKAYPVKAEVPDVFLFNAVLPSSAGFGTADATRSFAGNGGVLSQAGIEYSSGLHARFVDGVANVSFSFTRSCSGCVVEVVIGSLMKRFHVRPTTGGERQAVTVRAGGDRAVVLAPAGPPAEIWRNQPFLLTLWLVDAHGDRDVAAAPLESTIARVGKGQNGNGGTLLHTNDKLQLTEDSWSRGSLVWRLQFTSACLGCVLAVHGHLITVDVLSPAVALVVSSMVPASGLLYLPGGWEPDGWTAQTGRHTTLRVDLYASDDEGNRDYTVNANVTLALSYAAAVFAPPEIEQRGAGGGISFGGGPRAGVFEMAAGAAEGVVASFTETAIGAFLFFEEEVDPGKDAQRSLSSRYLGEGSLPVPPAVTIATPGYELTVLETSGGTMHEGNPFYIWTGVVGRDGWLAAEAEVYVTVDVSPDCDAGTVEVVGGTKHKLVRGSFRWEVYSVGHRVPSGTCELSFETTLTWGEDEAWERASDNATEQALHSWAAHLPPKVESASVNVTTSRVRPAKASWMAPDGTARGPPLFAVAGRATRGLVGVYSEDGLRSIEGAGSVSIGAVSCTPEPGGAAAVFTSVNQTFSGGAAEFPLLFSAAGTCSMRVASERYPVVNETFTVVVQEAVGVEIRENITSDANPVLYTGVPYPLTVYVVDGSGAVVEGDYATELSVEVITPAAAFWIQNRAGGSPAFAAKTPLVAVSAGVYTFQLVFAAKPERGQPFVQLQVQAGVTSARVVQATVDSEVIVVRSAPAALVLSPRPPAFWVVGRPFNLTVRLADPLRTVLEPDAQVPLEPRQISFSGAGFAKPPLDLLPVAPVGGATALMAGLQLTFGFVRTAAQAAVDLQVEGRGLAGAEASITFQEISGLAASKPAGDFSADRASGIAGGTWSFAVSIIDPTGAIVLGDSGTELSVSVEYRDGAPVWPGYAGEVKTVASGRATFDVVLREPAANLSVVFRARTSDPFFLWNRGHPDEPLFSNLSAAYGPFDVVAANSAPEQPAAVVYTPPVGSLVVGGAPGFDPDAFASAVEAALALGAGGVHVVWICPFSNETAAGDRTPESDCSQVNPARRLLVGSVAAARSAREAAVGAFADDEEVVVDFQLILTASEGLTGTYQHADAATRSAFDRLGLSLHASSALQSAIGYNPAYPLSVRALEAAPTPIPTKALYTPSTLVPRYPTNAPIDELVPLEPNVVPVENSAVCLPLLVLVFASFVPLAVAL